MCGFVSWLVYAASFSCFLVYCALVLVFMCVCELSVTARFASVVAVCVCVCQPQFCSLGSGLAAAVAAVVVVVVDYVRSETPLRTQPVRKPYPRTATCKRQEHDDISNNSALLGPPRIGRFT